MKEGRKVRKESKERNIRRTEGREGGRKEGRQEGKKVRKEGKTYQVVYVIKHYSQRTDRL